MEMTMMRRSALKNIIQENLLDQASIKETKDYIDKSNF
jgi:hypothetical protein